MYGISFISWINASRLASDSSDNSSRDLDDKNEPLSRASASAFVLTESDEGSSRNSPHIDDSTDDISKGGDVHYNSKFDYNMKVSNFSLIANVESPF